MKKSTVGFITKPSRKVVIPQPKEYRKAKRHELEDSGGNRTEPDSLMACLGLDYCNHHSRMS